MWSPLHLLLWEKFYSVPKWTCRGSTGQPSHKIKGWLWEFFMFLTTSLHVLPRKACTQRENSRFSTKVNVKVTQLCPTLCDPNGLYSPWKSPGQNTGVGSLSFACNAGDPGSISGLGRSPGEGIGYSFQYSWASLVAQLQCGRPGFNPWVGKIPWRRESLPTPVFWPGEFLGHGLYSSWGHKELDTTEPVLLSLSTKRQPLINFPLRWYEPALRKQKQQCCVAFVDLCHVNTPSMADFKDGCI